MPRSTSKENTPLLPGHPTPLPKKQLVVLCAAILSEPVQLTILFPFIYFMIRDFGLTDDETQIGWYAGLITTTFSLAQVMSSIPIGLLSDRIGRRPVLLLGLAGNVVSACMFGLSKSFAGAVVSRAMLGLVNGNIGVAKSITGEITDCTNRAKAFSLFGLCMALGGIVGPMIGGFLSNPADKYPALFGASTFFQTYPYFLPCAVGALISLTGFITGYFYLEETLKQEQAVPANPVVHVYDDTKKRFNLNNYLPSQAWPPVIGLGLLALTAIITQETYPLLAATPVNLPKNGLGFTTTDLGLSLCFQGCMTLLCQICIYHRAERHLGPIRTLRLGILLSTASTLLFPFLTFLARARPLVWSSLLPLLAMQSIGTMFCFTSMFLLVNDSAPTVKALGTVNGFAQMAACLARTIGPTVAGGAWSWSAGEGFGYPFLVYGIVVVLLGALRLESSWIERVRIESSS